MVRRDEPRAVSGLSVELFGPMRIFVNGEPVTGLRSRKCLWVFALLALRANREVDRHWLAATVWPSSMESQALYNLRDCLHDLRKHLGPFADRLESVSSHTIRLRLKAHECDVIQFDECLGSGSLVDLQATIERLNGQLLEGCAEEWVSAEREERNAHWADAIERVAECLIGDGNYDDAAYHLRKLVRAEPYRESGHRLLIRALAEGGRSSEASQVYQNLRGFLFRELGISPEPATVSAYNAARRSASIPSTAEGTPTGLKQKKQTSPVFLTQFIGRSQELADLIAILRANRLVTIMGTGGVGKTRIAAQLAKRLEAEGEFVVWWVNLAQIDSMVEIEDSVLASLGVKRGANRSAFQTVGEAIASRAGVLILDNCEHIVDASARLIQDLLIQCPNLRVVSTSQQRLGIPGERTYSLPPMALPDRVGPEMEGFDAVALFLDRVRDAVPNYTLPDSSRESVLALLKSLDAVPLAIELAATRIRFFSIEEICSRLDNRFNLLNVGNRTSLPRHQTLRALIDWSYELLTEEERAVLSQLAVFRGDWTLSAAEAVVAVGSDVQDILAALCDKSLIFVKRDAPETRYAMLESIRIYLLEKLSQNSNADQVHGRHAKWYAEVIAQAIGEMENRKHSEILDSVARDLDNLRSAWQFMRNQSQDRTEITWFATHLARYLYFRGHSVEGWRIIQESLLNEQECIEATARLKWLHAAGSLAFMNQAYDLSNGFFARLEKLGRQINDLTWVSVAETGRGSILGCQGRHSEAIVHYRASLQVARELKDPKLEIPSLQNIAHAYSRSGDYEEARRCARQALAIAESVPFHRGGAYLWSLIAWTFHREHRPNEAAEAYIHACGLHELNGDRYGEMECRYELAELMHSLDQLGEAHTQYDLALQLSNQLGNERWEAIIKGRYGRLLAEVGERESAAQALHESARAFAKCSDGFNMSAVFVGLAQLSLSKGDSTEASKRLGISVGLRERDLEVVHPHDQYLFDKVGQEIRRTLPTSDFDSAYQSGKLASWEGIIEEFK